MLLMLTRADDRFGSPFSWRLVNCTGVVNVGGVDLRPQMDLVRQGVHIAVATPGRLKDLLAKKRLNLDTCSYLCLDEADRMVDLGFEDDVRDVKPTPVPSSYCPFLPLLATGTCHHIGMKWLSDCAATSCS